MINPNRRPTAGELFNEIQTEEEGLFYDEEEFREAD